MVTLKQLLAGQGVGNLYKLGEQVDRRHKIERKEKLSELRVLKAVDTIAKCVSVPKSKKITR